MSRQRSSRIGWSLRARRQAKATCARSRRDRLAQGAEVATSWELALMGALVLRPRLVRSFAVGHPPAWFTSEVGLEILQALFCAATGTRKATLDDLIETLGRHDALALAGGPDAVRALVTPRPELDRAFLELDELVAALPAAEREQIARAEDLDDLDALIENGLKPTARVAISEDRAECLAVRHVAPVAEQLDLFESCRFGKENDHG